MDSDTGVAAAGIGFLVLVLAGLVTLMMWGCPQYNIYEQRLSGEAELAKAEYNRKTAVVEAESKRSAALALAGADTLRAMGVARSNQIIGQSLKENRDYLTWLWVESLKERNGDVIYVPTEANLPILEAMRRNATVK